MYEKGDFDRQESIFRLVVEAAPNAIVMVDGKGEISLVNRQTEILFGYTRDELIGKRIEMLMPERIRVQHTMHRNGFQRDLGTRAMGAGRDLYGLRKSGEEIPIEIGLTPIRFNEEVFILASIIDIAERKRLEELRQELAIREKVSELRDNIAAIVESSDDAIYGKNTDGIITSWNKAAERMYGYVASEMIGRPFDLLIPKEWSWEAEKIHIALMKGEHFEHYETKRLCKNGEIIDVSVSISPTRDSLGHIAGASAIARDITHAKRLEAMREQLMMKLEKANKELASFAHVVSHDLKAPLRGIHSLAEWIVQDYGDRLDEEGKKKLAMLQERVRKMHTLIDGILEYSRIGRVQEEIVSLDLNNLLSGIVELLAPPAHITIELQRDLPVIQGEKTCVHQLFQNLLSNAIKYNDKSQGRIHVGSQDEGATWRFTVRDNGLGIDEKYHERIFELFQTLGVSENLDSTGIGLSLVKKIVEKYGGTIGLESKPGQGSTFWFTYPKIYPTVGGGKP